MSQSVRAIYRDGNLELQEHVDLANGESVEVIIRSERDRIIAALGDLVMTPSQESVERYKDIDEDALQREIDDELRGRPLQPPLSETIIQERREGP